jgi:regulatory protein
MRVVPDKPRRRPKGTALDYAVKLLSVRAYTERRLREKLAARAFTSEEIAEAIKRLKEQQFLDDRRFAAEFIRSRLANQPRTGMALVRELIQRGLSRKFAETAVKENVPATSEEDLARELLRRKQTLYGHLDAVTRKRRLMALLARRGFSYEIISKVLKTDSTSVD